MKKPVKVNSGNIEIFKYNSLGEDNFILVINEERIYLGEKEMANLIKTMRKLFGKRND